jgi:hypothetical protein
MYPILFVQGKERIAVLDFKGYIVSDEMGLAISEIIRTKFVERGKYIVVERSLLNQVIEEQNLQQTGLIDKATAVEIGKIIGADYVIIGSIVKMGEILTLNVRSVLVKTGEIKIAKSISCSKMEELPHVCERIVFSICGDVVNESNQIFSNYNHSFDKIKKDKYELTNLIIDQNISISYRKLDLPKTNNWYPGELLWHPNGNFFYIKYYKDCHYIIKDNSYNKIKQEDIHEYIISSDFKKIRKIYGEPKWAFGKTKTIKNRLKSRLSGIFKAKIFYHDGRESSLDRITWNDKNKIHPASVNSFCCSPSGKYLFFRSASHSGFPPVIISDETTAKYIWISYKHKINKPYLILDEDKYHIYGYVCAWSPDGKYIILASNIEKDNNYQDYIIVRLDLSLKSIIN